MKIRPFAAAMTLGLVALVLPAASAATALAASYDPAPAQIVLADAPTMTSMPSPQGAESKGGCDIASLLDTRDIGTDGGFAKVSLAESDCEPWRSICASTGTQCDAYMCCRFGDPFCLPLADVRPAARLVGSQP